MPVSPGRSSSNAQAATCSPGIWTRPFSLTHHAEHKFKAHITLTHSHTWRHTLTASAHVHSGNMSYADAVMSSPGRPSLVEVGNKRTTSDRSPVPHTHNSPERVRRHALKNHLVHGKEITPPPTVRCTYHSDPCRKTARGGIAIIHHMSKWPRRARRTAGPIIRRTSLIKEGRWRASVKMEGRQ